MKGPRFQFGENWQRFLSTLDDKRISLAEDSMTSMLEMNELGGKHFLDVGSGSGLSSLVARRLGARVHSFDIDAESVACTKFLKDRFFRDDLGWVIEQGSILETSWLAALGKFDVVYSWGVLHHTGSMWQALTNVDPLVNRGGKLFIAIYNDQGMTSDFWRIIKRLYNHLPSGLRFLLTWPALICLWGPTTIRDFLRGKPSSTWRGYAKARGMSPWHDLVDWVGGYPFEVATREAIINFYETRGYKLEKLNSCGRGLGCNQFVFRKL